MCIPLAKDINTAATSDKEHILLAALLCIHLSFVTHFGLISVLRIFISFPSVHCKDIVEFRFVSLLRTVLTVVRVVFTVCLAYLYPLVRDYRETDFNEIW